MAAKDLRSAFSKNRINNNPEARSLGVVGMSENVREELERKAETVAVQEIALSQLLDNPYQHLARSSTDHSLSRETLEELAASIQQNGFYGALLARPLSASDKNNNSEQKYELAYGHRRRAAAQMAGLRTLPVKVMELTNSQMARIMASENFSREDLTPMGEANVVGMLYTSQNLSADKIAEVIGKTRRWVQLRIELYEAPQDIKDMTERKYDTLTYVPILRQIRDGEERKELIEAVLNDQLTREQLRNAVENLKKSRNGAKIVNSATNSTQGSNGDGFHNNAIQPENQGANPVTLEREPLTIVTPGESSFTDTNFREEASLLSENKIYNASYRTVLKELESVITKLESLARYPKVVMTTAEQTQFQELLERVNSLLD
jgi:ParB family chromosome partitioning protein